MRTMSARRTASTHSNTTSGRSLTCGSKMDISANAGPRNSFVCAPRSFVASSTARSAVSDDDPGRIVPPMPTTVISFPPPPCSLTPEQLFERSGTRFMMRFGSPETTAKGPRQQAEAQVPGHVEERGSRDLLPDTFALWRRNGPVCRASPSWQPRHLRPMRATRRVRFG